MMKWLLAALVLIAGPVQADYLLNGKGAGVPYKVYRITDDGAYTKPTLIIGPSGSGFDAAHVYWPSGLNVGGVLYVYANGNDGAGNVKLGLWKSADGIIFTRIGAVLSPIAGEGQIGPAHVVYDPADVAAPFKLWYSTNYSGGVPTAIKYATSLDGVTWARQATVITASESYETQGISLDYVCRDSGTWRMFYNASGGSDIWNAIEADATSPSAAFAKAGIVFAAGGVSKTVLSSVAPGQRYLKLDSTSGLVVGGVYVLGNASTSSRVVIEAILDGDEASIKDGMIVSGVGFSLKDAGIKKVAVSAIYPDGSDMRALFTGWGANGAIQSEYVFEGKQAGSGFVRDYSAKDRWKILGPGAEQSFENPSPIKSGPDC